jgi:hypothetical protein
LASLPRAPNKSDRSVRHFVSCSGSLIVKIDVDGSRQAAEQADHDGGSDSTLVHFEISYDHDFLHGLRIRPAIVFDAENAERRAGFDGVGAQVKDCALLFAEIGEIDIDGDHATHHRLVRVGYRLFCGTIEILSAVKRMRTHIAGGQHRSTQRKVPTTPDDEAALTADIIALAIQYGRYGYRRITVMLHRAGWVANVKRVERIWRREGLKVPQKQPKRGRLWLNDGSCIRLRPEYPNHVWSYDFVEDRTHNGKKFRMLNVIDEFTRECISIKVSRRLKAVDVIDVLPDLFILRGIPGHIRSDNVLRAGGI